MITTGFNSRDELISASQALSREKYHCPHCGAIMAPVRSSLGNYFFRLCKGQEHTLATCQAAARSNKIHLPELTSAEVFHGKILKGQEDSAATPKGETGGGTRILAEELTRPLTSLKDLYTMGYDRSDDIPLQGCRLSDILINPKIAAKTAPEGFDGNRVFACRFTWYYRVQKILRFALFYFTQEAPTHRKFNIFLSFQDNEDYTYFQNRLFKLCNPKERRNVFIHGTWKKIGCDECKKISGNTVNCSSDWKCQGLAFISEFQNRKQIYIPSEAAPDPICQE